MNEETRQYYKDFGEAMGKAPLQSIDSLLGEKECDMESTEVESPYDWYDKLKAGVVRVQEEKAERSRKAREEFRQKALDKRNKDQQLFYKALDKSHRDNEIKRDKEIERAKAEAAKQVEEEFERKHNIYSEKTRKFYSDILNNIKNIK